MEKRHRILLIIALVLLPVLAYFHLTIGQIQLSSADFYNAVFNYSDSETAQLLVREFRLPRLIMAIVAGSSLAIAGMLMQTLFNNPLAGPYVLGINSGASLAVALGTLSGISMFSSNIGLIGLALIGALVFGFIVLGFSLFVRNSLSLLLVGIMIGSFTSAITSLLQTISSADSLKVFTIWGMGSLQQVELSQIGIITVFFILGIFFSFFLIKPLNALVLGENASLLLGVPVKNLRIIIIVITALLAGLVTAFCGPIAFVGLAIPNLCKMLFKTQQHLVLLLGNILLGALFLISCDILVQGLEPFILVPINVITSIVGAPFVIFIILKRLA
ncbi:MAG: iron ABC transporter permease [Crocinitomicaceae bacterium]|nr:iron ABC transporter permease [Crocinitomicaceae bacterium]MDP4865415.1 iron ABC transporter permease [Crocinitomicaceae bacterium]MDP5009745.1 iron ABC transporter permease [Crocinitomicaceae bacterium]